jgi:hypothetical protein
MKRNVWLVVIALCAASCSPEAFLDKLATSPEGQYAEAALAEARSGHVDELRARLVREASAPDLEARLASMVAHFPKATPSRVRLVGYNAEHVVGGISRYVFTYESFYPGGNLVSDVVVRRDNGNLELERIHLQRIPATLEVLNAFTLHGKGAAQYAVLAAALAVLGTTLVALVLWFRSGRIRGRWWWLVAILVGMGKIGVQWTNRTVIAQSFAIQLLSCGFSRDGLYGPWTLAVSIPVGALAFIIARPLLLARATG